MRREMEIMSGWGQKAKYTLRADVFRFTPESGLKSDIAPCPKSANRRHRSLFDDLIGAAEQHGWNFEPKRLRCLEIDHKLEFGRLLHRQVGGPLALENSVDVAGRLPGLLDPVYAIRH